MQTEATTTLTAAPQALAANRRLVFEPHNGYGGKTPDGEPWPFGYLSEVEPTSPVFELNVIVKHDPQKLLAYARMCAAAPDLLEALKMVCDSGVALADLVEQAMLEAIKKAEGR